MLQSLPKANMTDIKAEHKPRRKHEIRQLWGQGQAGSLHMRGMARQHHASQSGQHAHLQRILASCQALFLPFSESPLQVSTLVSSACLRRGV